MELPEVRQTRVDLLFEVVDANTNARRLIAMELQSFNDAHLPVRMAEYSLRVYRLRGQFPEQYVLYMGSEKMRMPAALESPNHICRYTIVDVSTWDSETLLNSPFPADAVMAILTRYAERPEVIQRILARIAKLGKDAGSDALNKLLILAGMRGLEERIEKEAKLMPILNDIMDHRVLGPAIRKGLEQGREEGKQEGRKEGRQEGRKEEALAFIRRLITKRFGPLPIALENRLSQLTTAELEDLGERFVDATSLADLRLGQP